MTTPHTQGQEVNPRSAKTTHGTLVNDPPLVAGSLLTVVDYAQILVQDTAHSTPQVLQTPLVAKPKLGILVNDPPLVAEPLLTVVDLNQILGLDATANRIVHPAARHHTAPHKYQPHRGTTDRTGPSPHEPLGQETIKPPHKSPTEERAHCAKHKPTTGELGTVCRFGMFSTGPGTILAPAETTHGTLVNDPPPVAGSLLTVVSDYAHEPVRNRPAKAKKTA